jgi:hypothetical protein
MSDAALRQIAGDEGEALERRNMLEIELCDREG